MPSFGFNGIIARPAPFGTTGSGLSSVGISIPRGAQTMTVHMPQLKAATTYRVESVVPLASSDQALVWNTLNWVNDDGSAGAAVINALSGLGSTAAAQTLVFKDSHIGVGVIRFTVSAAQDADLSATVIFEVVS